MAGDFNGKIALVTGGSMGIGRATALAFAARGAKVSVADVDIDGGEETVALIKESGGEAIFIKTDVSNSAEVHELIKQTVKTYGKLDYAHNNAAINRGIGVMAADYKEDDWDIQLDVNLKGIWLCMKYEIPEMLKQGQGTAIVNTSSISGLSGHPADPGYVGSKFGVVGITKSTALQYARSGIRINCVCPGPIRTSLYDRVVSAIPGVEEATLDRNPMGRVGEPEEVAQAVMWLCSDDASYVTGVPLPVDGGLAAL
jgi:NAD(P)-dependent dehydrogenase (short-subunit alcohol dehydrogenase family)